jgi:hypothetical protein
MPSGWGQIAYENGPGQLEKEVTVSEAKPQQRLPHEIAKQLWRWNAIALSHRAVYVVFGLVGVVAPLVVAAYSESLEQRWIKALSLSGAVAVAIFAAFDVGGLATRWREAWKHLNSACLAFELGLIDLTTLVKAYGEGEMTIGKMKSDIFAKQSPNDNNQA